MEIKITRVTLYNEVWQKPVTKVAKDYGISDVGLKKICKKLDVPTPPRGYWARKQAGFNPSVKPLSVRKQGIPDEYTLIVSEDEESKNEVQTLIIQEIGDIVVPKRLISPHPLVQKTKEALLKQQPDSDGIIRAYQGFYIRITPESVSRTLRILDSLLKSLIDYHVKIDSIECVMIEGEKVEFSLYEVFHRVERSKTDLETNPLLSHRQWKMAPTGRLRISLDEYSGYGLRKRWSDGKKKRLEDQLSDVIKGMGRVAFSIRQKRIEHEEWCRRWEEEKRKQAEVERLRIIEEEKRKDLEIQAERWKRSQLLHDYLDAVEKQTSEVSQDWLLWARKYADSLNPLNSN